MSFRKSANMIVKNCTKGQTYTVDLISRSGHSIRNALVVSKFGREVRSPPTAGSEMFQKLRSQFIYKNNQRFFAGSYQAMTDFDGYCVNVKSPAMFSILKVRKIAILFSNILLTF